MTSRRDLLHALRNLHRRDLLTESPLVTALFVRERVDDSIAAALRDAILDGIRKLAEDPIDRPAALLLEAAFVVVPRRKQLALASDLGMGFSTYRRHLAAAIDALLDVLTADPRRTREPLGPSMDDVPERCASPLPSLPNTRRRPRPLHARGRSR